MTFPQPKTWSQWLSWLWQEGRALLVDPAEEKQHWHAVNNPEPPPQPAKGGRR